jgi:transcriptional regulator with XRE-family HTH domain
MKVTDNIFWYRKAKGWNQRTFGNKIGKSREWVTKSENGKIDLKVSVLEKIAAAFEVPLMSLFEDSGKKPIGGGL